mgnify:CR=1 FL=1|tara:strand:- start:16750 stop:17133 length:384 start_codon:yes stop_codon:yes gene_type:complete
MKNIFLKALASLLIFAFSTSTFAMTALCYSPNEPYLFSHIVAWTGTDWFGWDNINHVTKVYNGFSGYEVCVYTFQKTIDFTQYSGSGQWNHNFPDNWPHGWWYDGIDLMYSDSPPPGSVYDSCTMGY